jgi:hypothetical protein
VRVAHFSRRQGTALPFGANSLLMQATSRLFPKEEGVVFVAIDALGQWPREQYLIACRVSRACPDKGDVLGIELPADKFIKNWTRHYREASLMPIIAKLIDWAEGR